MMSPETARGLAASCRDFEAADRALRGLPAGAPDGEAQGRALTYLGCRRAHQEQIDRAEREVRDAEGGG